MAKKTYEVVGDSIVHGFKKGETFVANLGEQAEALLVEAGHIIVREKSAAEAPPAASATAATATSGTPTA